MVQQADQAHCTQLQQPTRQGQSRPPCSKSKYPTEVYETMPGTRELTFLPRCPSVMFIVARNSFLRPSLEKRVASDAFNPKNILGALGVKGSQSAELGKRGYEVS
ncbi:unnamed protein product [Heterosigma akashiwo]